MTSFRIETVAVSRYRSEIMGFAMLAIILFHVRLPRADLFYGLCRMGNVGVDMFLFLSGIGLWFSWCKLPSFRSFYLHRCRRIYPAWLMMSGLFYIPRFLHGSHSFNEWLNLLGNLLCGSGFWLYGDLTFWYVPAIMLLYVFAPFYMQLLKRSRRFAYLPLLVVFWCFVVQYCPAVHSRLGYLEIFWSRIPIFLIGINFGEIVKRKVVLQGLKAQSLLPVFILILALCVYLEQTKHGCFPLFYERLLYIPMSISGMLLLGKCLSHASTFLNEGLAFVGTVCLECYLIHEHFVLPPLRTLNWGYWGTALSCIAISLPLSWALHKVLTLLVKSLEHSRI